MSMDNLASGLGDQNSPTSSVPLKEENPIPLVSSLANTSSNNLDHLSQPQGAISKSSVGAETSLQNSMLKIEYLQGEWFDEIVRGVEEDTRNYHPFTLGQRAFGTSWKPGEKLERYYEDVSRKMRTLALAYNSLITDEEDKMSVKAVNFFTNILFYNQIPKEHHKICRRIWSVDISPVRYLNQLKNEIPDMGYCPKQRYLEKHFMYWMQLKKYNEMNPHFPYTLEITNNPYVKMFQLGRDNGNDVPQPLTSQSEGEKDLLESKQTQLKAESSSEDGKEYLFNLVKQLSDFKNVPVEHTEEKIEKSLEKD